MGLYNFSKRLFLFLGLIGIFAFFSGLTAGYNLNQLLHMTPSMKTGPMEPGGGGGGGG